MDTRAPSPPSASPEGNRLGRRLLLAIVLFSVAASLVGTTVQLAADYRGEVRALEERLEQIRSSYARSVAQSLWSLDEEPLRLQLEGMTTLPGIVRAEVDSALGTHYVAGAAPAADEVLVRENESIYLPLGCVHRLENPGRIPLTLIEVQSGSYLGEDDIVRIEDTYGRA